MMQLLEHTPAASVRNGQPDCLGLWFWESFRVRRPRWLVGRCDSETKSCLSGLIHMKPSTVRAWPAWTACGREIGEDWEETDKRAPAQVTSQSDHHVDGFDRES
jgi:hypothetical protein